MTQAVATRAKARAKAISRAGGGSAASPDFRSADELHEVLERTLTAVDRSSDAGTRLKAANLNIRVEVEDLGSVCSVRASDHPGHYIQWRFDRRGRPKPTLILIMDSATANAWLQGRESIPMAIARRRMRCSGNARDALRYLPLLKLISQRYRKLVRSDYPHLAIS
jgi:hypothetical protein